MLKIAWLFIRKKSLRGGSETIRIFHVTIFPRAASYTYYTWATITFYCLYIDKFISKEKFVYMKFWTFKEGTC